MRRLRSRRWRHEHRRGLRKTAAIGIPAVLILGLGTAAAAAGAAQGFGSEKVGTSNAKGILLPTNQRITPVGNRLLVDDGRLLSSSISPDGRYLAALTWNDFTGYLTIIDLKHNKIVQQVGTGSSADRPSVTAPSPPTDHCGPPTERPSGSRRPPTLPDSPSRATARSRAPS